MTSDHSATVDVRVSFVWRPAGAVVIEDAGKLRFPTLPARPGLYRMTLTKRPGQRRPHIYVGETDNLQRRASHYRNPGPTQQTNIRLNQLLRTHLADGGVASLDMVTEAMVAVASGAAAVALDLRSAAARRLAENAAVVGIAVAGVVDLANL